MQYLSAVGHDISIAPTGVFFNTSRVIHLPGVGADNPGMDIFTIRYRNLRDVLSARKMKLTELAAEISRSESQVSSFAGSNPSKKIGEKIARIVEAALDLPPNYLDDPRNLGTAESQATYAAEPSNAAFLAKIQQRLPVVGMATAGKLIENFTDAEIEEYVPAPGPCGPRSFVLRLEGISMVPKFHSGDRIVIDPDAEWVSGDYVFATKNNTETGIPTGTFKQILYEEGSYFLCALNEQWTPRYTKINGDWEVVGKGRYRVEIL